MVRSQQYLSFGDLVRRRRRALELTQAQLGERVACSEDMVRKIEADLRRPSRWLADRMLKQLQIDAGDEAAFLKAARVGGSVSLPGAAAPSPDARAAATSGVTLADREGELAALRQRLIAASNMPVVGRAAELAVLRERIAAARRGQGSLVLIEGEPGIGKSYLAQAAVAEAVATGFGTCGAACYEIDRAIPLQPMADWTLRMLDIYGPTLVAALSLPALAELTELLPQLGELRPGVPSAAGAPELKRARIFNAFVELTVARLQAAPMLIVVDDIHWADEMTLPLLHHLARQTRAQPLVLVCTLRSEELATNDALALFVQSAVADLGASRLALARWNADDVRELLAAQDDMAGRPDLAARLMRSSEGHPLYVTSMVQQLRDRHDTDHADAHTEPALPPALRDSIRERLRRLSPQPRAILDIAAVLGRRFDFFALERGAGMAGGALADAVDLLIQRQLLREIDDGASFDFAHGKIREVVYDDLGSARRIVLHRRAAEALIASEGDHAAAIAEHCELAGQWDEAVRHHERAAQRSLGLSALHEAGRAVERALALARAHPSAADAAMRARLHERSGDVHAQDGRSAEAVAAFQAALQGVRALGNAAWTRDLLTKLGMAYRRADDYERARDTLGESLAASRALSEPHQIADTLYHLGTVAWSDGDNTLALACHGEAVQLCEAHQLTGLVAVQAWHGDGEGHMTHGEPARAIERFTRSLTLARELGDRGYEAENLMMIGWSCTGSQGLADYERAADHAARGIALAESSEQEWHLAPLRALQADAWRCMGRTREALALLESERQRTESADQVRFGIIVRDTLGRLLLEQDRHEEARACFDSAIEAGARRGINFWRAQVVAGDALARLACGDVVDTEVLRRQSDWALAHGDRCGHAHCLRVLAEAALRARDMQGARDDAARLLALAESGGLREQAALAHWLSGRSWTDESPERARSELAAALDAAETLGRPWLACEVHESMAALCERAGQRKPAAAHRKAVEEWRGRFRLPQ